MRRITTRRIKRINDPFDGAQAPLFRTGKNGPLRVNPKQAPALRLGSRRVDFLFGGWNGSIIGPAFHPTNLFPHGCGKGDDISCRDHKVLFVNGST